MPECGRERAVQGETETKCHRHLFQWDNHIQRLQCSGIFVSPSPTTRRLPGWSTGIRWASMRLLQLPDYTLKAWLPVTHHLLGRDRELLAMPIGFPCPNPQACSSRAGVLSASYLPHLSPWPEGQVRRLPCCCKAGEWWPQQSFRTPSNSWYRSFLLHRAISTAHRAPAIPGFGNSQNLVRTEQ